jgi:ubiquinone/menaquinone biosynthesis C-methylase UbiE
VRNRRALCWLAGLVAGALAAAAWRLYSRRPRERVPSLEGIDDAEAARAYGWLSRMPPMRLLRWLAVRRVVAMRPQGLAVDLGCGPGLLVLELARQAPGLEVVGVDLSAEMVDLGEENARRAGLEEWVSFRQGDAQQIPFEDGSLDLLVSTLSLHHWSDPQAVLDEIARVLRPGGAFLVFDLRRDMPAPAYLLLWFAQHVVVPPAIRRVGEPLGSRNAAYTVPEATELAERSALRGWRVTGGPLWLTISGYKG